MLWNERDDTLWPRYMVVYRVMNNLMHVHSSLHG